MARVSCWGCRKDCFLDHFYLIYFQSIYSLLQMVWIKQTMQTKAHHVTDGVTASLENTSNTFFKLVNDNLSQVTPINTTCWLR